MSDKLLIITGGSSGIGHATIRHFQEQGWDCLNLSRHPCDHSGIHHIKCDLTSTDWNQTLDLTPYLKNKLKIALVHNAACCFSDHVNQLSADQLRQAFELNVVAPSQLNQYLMPYLRPGSAIIYIGSTLSEKAIPGMASYITTKHAVVGLMRATCQDLAGTEIHTACVCPGMTDTPMLRQRIGENPALLSQLAHKQTSDRFIQPEEIASVIWFCATHPVINGSVVHSHLGQRET